MIKNLSLVIVVDLEHPESIRESFFNWISFINSTLMNYISDLDPDLRNALKARFEKVYARNKLIYSTTSDNENNEANLAEETMDFDFSLGVPILIVGNKSDMLDNLETKAIDNIQYILRSFAVKYGASVMYASSKSNSNLDTLADYLSYILLDDDKVKLKVDVSNDKLFIPLGFDHAENLENDFQEARNFTFMKKGKNQANKQSEKNDADADDIIDPEEFLKGLKDGKVLYAQLPRERLPMTNPAPSAPGQQPIRPSIFGKPADRIIQILGMNRKPG
jgi:hypothetical protein